MSVSITSISISISISSSSSSGSGGSNSSRGSKAMFSIQLRHVNKHTNKYPSSAVCLIKTLTAATCFDPC